MNLVVCCHIYLWVLATWNWYCIVLSNVFNNMCAAKHSMAESSHESCLSATNVCLRNHLWRSPVDLTFILLLSGFVREKNVLHCCRQSGRNSGIILGWRIPSFQQNSQKIHKFQIGCVKDQWRKMGSKSPSAGAAVKNVQMKPLRLCVWMSKSWKYSCCSGMRPTSH